MKEMLHHYDLLITLPEKETEVAIKKIYETKKNFIWLCGARHAKKASPNGNLIYQRAMAELFYAKNISGG